ncbi:hypothetical protein [Enterococcus alishanensis]
MNYETQEAESIHEITREDIQNYSAMGQYERQKKIEYWKSEVFKKFSKQEIGTLLDNMLIENTPKTGIGNMVDLK